MIKLLLNSACAALALLVLFKNELPAYGPVKIDAGVYWRFDVKLGSGPHIPKAPWYAYFPYDPNVQCPSPGSPYPVWPQTLPPGGGEAAPAPVPDLSAGSPATGVHSVGYRGGVPSYWYGR